MKTPYDWLTVSFFAGLVVLLLQRSSGPEEKWDSLYHYAFPAIACMATNYLGNQGYHIAALTIFIAAIAYTFHFLKPLKR